MRVSGKTIRLGVLLSLSWLIPLMAAPPWWTSRGVVEPEEVPADYAPLVLGQLKWMATNAYLELDESLPGGAGSEVLALVQGFQNSNNWLTVNIGQLKAAAKPFYDRLIAEGVVSNYPWTATTNDDQDLAIASIGQLKYVFDFDLSDVDGDGMPDDWEIEHFGDLARSGNGDYDGDGMSDLAEWIAETNPTNADTDGDAICDGQDTNPLLNQDSDEDGLPDDWEVYWFGNLSQGAAGDPDGDGSDNLAEKTAGTDPGRRDIEDLTNGLGLEVFRPLK